MSCTANLARFTNQAPVVCLRLVLMFNSTRVSAAMCSVTADVRDDVFDDLPGHVSTGVLDADVEYGFNLERLS
jgi:hypothetical protein